MLITYHQLLVTKQQRNTSSTQETTLQPNFLNISFWKQKELTKIQIHSLPSIQIAKVGFEKRNLHSFFFFFFWLCWVIAAAQAFLQLQETGGYSLVAVCGLLTAMASPVVEFGLQGIQASVVVACGLRSCVSPALEHRLNSCGAGAQLLSGMWDLPQPGVKPVSPALAGRFFTTEPPGKPQKSPFLIATPLDIFKQRAIFCAELCFLHYAKMAKDFCVAHHYLQAGRKRKRNKRHSFHSQAIPTSTPFSQIKTQLQSVHQHSRLNVHSMADTGSRSKYSAILQVI